MLYEAKHGALVLHEDDDHTSYVQGFAWKDTVSLSQSVRHVISCRATFHNSAFLRYTLGGMNLPRRRSEYSTRDWIPKFRPCLVSLLGKLTLPVMPCETESNRENNLTNGLSPSTGTRRKLQS